jgi:cysteinyl-tRNA synthetase
VLWKPSKPGEPGWPSPAGIKTPGRPGWHIECSAMSWKHLGETFDIHGGGIDLVFPHHENEIAQSRCAFHSKVMANFWMHNGFLQVEGEKMSKSLGNFTIIRDVLADWPGDVVRFAMLGSHYRQPINWTVKGLEEAEKALAGFFDTASAEADPRPAEAVLEALLDDLNTPKAIAEMHGLKNAAGRRALAGTLGFFGFRQDELAAWRAKNAPAPALPADEIESRITARNAARKAKNFAESDRIRDELAKLGVVLKDSKDGTTWEVAR